MQVREATTSSAMREGLPVPVKTVTASRGETTVLWGSDEPASHMGAKVRRTTGPGTYGQGGNVVYGAGDVRVEEVPDPFIAEPADLLARLLVAP
jgi:hypothetical protein